MNTIITKSITIIVALAVTGLSVALSIASAYTRASTQHDQLLLAALGVVTVVSVHLLPGLIKGRQRLVMWPVWVACFCLVGFGHASWFLNAAEDASTARTAGSAAAIAVVKEREAIGQALGEIKARPVAVVAAQLSRTTSTKRREALALELAEARRAASMRDRLVSLAGNVMPQPETRGNDRVTAGNVEGNARGMWSMAGGVGGITTAAAVAAAVVVEVLGALLWAAALRGEVDAQQPGITVQAVVPTVTQQIVNLMSSPLAQPVQPASVPVIDEVADLRGAIERGECRATVQSIRVYMGCKTETAARLRRALEVTT
jgi:hypothetical protein